MEDAWNLLEGRDRIPRGTSSSGHDEASALRRRLADHPEEIDGGRRLLAEVVRDEHLRRLLSSRYAPWTASRAVAPGAITVISGDAPRVGESTARHLLAVYLALLWSALLSRRAPNKTFLVLDEAHWYLHESAAEILRMGRRHNVHLWVATQSVRSLTEPAQDALLTNCSEIVLFRTAPADAREFSRWNTSLGLERLATMPRGTAAVLIEKGSEVHWWAGRRERSDRPDEGRLSRIARDSVALYRPAPGEAEADGPKERYPPAPRQLLLLLLAGWEARPADGPLEVKVSRLRESMDPSGSMVRDVGTRLSRVGALRSVQREGAGTVWLIDPPGPRALIEPPPSEDERAWATSRWTEITSGHPEGNY